MLTRIQKLGLVNGIKSSGKKYNLSEMIQESYKVSYEAKRINNKKLINLTESHLANIKKDPTDTKLSEDLDVLKGLVTLGKDQSLKDVEEVSAPKKRRKKSVNSCVKPMKQIKESSWSNSRASMTKALKSFRESAKSKVFYKELDKFNKSISKKSPITMSEAVNLYKACNSCLTHLTVELERNPSFRKSYKECTDLLSKDNQKLLESIQNGNTPSRALLESFVTFTNILLECDTPEKLDPEIYEDADMEELDDRDVLNEDADMEELDGRDVIAEDADMEELDDRDVLNENEDVDDEEESDMDEDADMEELDDRDVLNEEEEVSPEDDSSVSVDLTPEEIAILKSILGKISSMEESEDLDLVDDEEEVPEINEDEEDFDDEEFVDDEELEEDDDFEEEEEDFEDEDLEEEDECDTPVEGGSPYGLNEEDEDPVTSLEGIKDQIDNVINKMSDDMNEDDEEEDNEMDFELTESAINRIKKCF